MTPKRYAIFATLVSDGMEVTDGALAFEGDRITYAGSRDGFAALPDAHSFSTIDVPPGSVVVPGLIDLHCHGALGTDFSSPEASGLAAALEFLHASGTTTLLASLAAAPRAQLLQAAELLAEQAEAGLLAGIHAEGPFLSPQRAGAQDQRALCAPEQDFVDELVMASRGQLRTMTYAPELPGADELAEQLASHGVVPSLGHTDAGPGIMADGLDFAREQLQLAGVDGFTEVPTATHLFNGMPPMHHRCPGPAGEALEKAAAGEAIVELVADGVHLDPLMIRLVFRLAGARSIVLVSDSTSATGLADGTYQLAGQQITTAAGRALLAGTSTLAGSTSTLLDVVRCTVAAGVPLVAAIESATKVPASLIGLADEAGSLHQGFAADVLVLDQELALVHAIRKGQVLGPAGQHQR